MTATGLIRRWENAEIKIYIHVYSICIYAYRARATITESSAGMDILLNIW